MGSITKINKMRQQCTHTLYLKIYEKISMSEVKAQYIRIEQECSHSKKKDREVSATKQQKQSGDSNTNVIRDDRDEKMRVKRYDYLNKYSQHEILGQYNSGGGNGVGKLSHSMDQRKSRWQRIDKRQRQKQRKQSQQKPNKSVKLKANKPRSYSKSSSKGKPRHEKESQKKSSAHYQYLQAYQNNIPQEHLPYSLQLSPSQRSNHEQCPSLPVPLPQQHKPMSYQTQKSLQLMLSKIPNLTNSLSLELTHQNELYRGQINEYRTMLAKMEMDLANLQEKFVMGEQLWAREKMCYEGIIRDLKEEVVGLRGFRERYEILNEEMSRMTAKMVELEESGCGCNNNKENCDLFNSYGQNRSTNARSRSKGKIKKNNQHSHPIQKQIFQKIQQLLTTNPNTNTNTRKADLKLSAFSQSVLQNLTKLILNNKTYQDFIFNIRQMHRKIEKTKNDKNPQGPTVRQLWKWLKLVGSHYSFMLEIKPILVHKAGIHQIDGKNLEIKQLLELVLVKL